MNGTISDSRAIVYILSALQHGNANDLLQTPTLMRGHAGCKASRGSQPARKAKCRTSPGG